MVPPFPPDPVAKREPAWSSQSRCLQRKKMVSAQSLWRRHWGLTAAWLNHENGTLCWARTRAAQHPTRDWNEDHVPPPRPRMAAPGHSPAALLDSQGALSGVRRFPRHETGRDSLLPEEKVERCRHTRVNIECDGLLISCTKAISINEVCLRLVTALLR